MKIAQPRDGEPIRLVMTKQGVPRYRVRVDAGTGAGGNRRQVWSTHDTLTAARAHVAAHRTDRERGVLLAPDKQTFTEYADAWHARRALQVREVTAASYKVALKRAKQAFGEKLVSKVQRADVDRVIADLFAAGRSKRTAAFTLFVLRAVFEDALDEKLIGSNPARRVKAAGRPAKERQGLEVAAVRKLRAHLADDRLLACWLLTTYGLRRSEVMGLRWSDVDLTKATLTIARGRVLVDGKRTVEGPTKTKRGARTLNIPEDLLVALRRLRIQQLDEFGSEQARSGYLAVDEACEPIRPERWTDLWREHCKAAGVPAVTLHGARHSSVTAMRAAGVPDYLVAAWHGHDENVMRAVYTHANAQGLAAAGLALSEAYAYS